MDEEMEEAVPAARAAAAAPSGVRIQHAIALARLRRFHEHVAGERPAEAEEEGRHLGVECDECGENPIVGTRFKCLTRRNYDVCRQCWQDNHAAHDGGANFAPCETRLTYTQTRLMEPPEAKRSVMVYSLTSLAQELNRDAHLEDLTFYPQGVVPNEAEAQAAQQALAHHTGVKTFHIYTRSSQDVDRVVQVVAEGLLHNQSVFSVGFSIATNTRFRQLAPETVQALHKLVITNNHIQYLFLKRPRSPSLDTASFASVPTEQDNLESSLFDALAHCHLQTFRFEAHRPVSDHSKKKAWAAMESNPSLRRICVAKFEHPDPFLHTLTMEKKHHWMKRWTELDGSDQQRCTVLEEVRNNLHENDLDTVNALYRLVRGQPGSLLETTLPAVVPCQPTK